jgi:hypothetical protein
MRIERSGDVLVVYADAIGIAMRARLRLIVSGLDAGESSVTC